MRRKRIEKLLKAKILSESLKEGCVITQLAKEYGVSKNTIYGWRSKYKESVPSVCLNAKLLKTSLQAIPNGIPTRAKFNQL